MIDEESVLRAYLQSELARLDGKPARCPDEVLGVIASWLCEMAKGHEAVNVYISPERLREYAELIRHWNDSG